MITFYSGFCQYDDKSAETSAISEFFPFWPRAAGKATLLEQSFDPETTERFDLLEPEVFERFWEEPSALARSLEALPPRTTHVILDEIQQVPKLLDIVQMFIGQKRFHFALTGSSARKLRRGQANLLGGRDAGTNHNTVSSYFEILEDTLLGFRLHAFEHSFRRRLRTKPKFCFFDLGVTRQLRREPMAVLKPGTSLYGDTFEHLVLLELKTLASYKKPDWEFSFLQTEAGREIDIVIETGWTELI